MAKSKIEWTTETWNVITGCSKVSAGCKNCYAIPMSWRNQHNEITKKKYEGVVEKTKGGDLNFTGKVNFDEATLLKPLQTKKPTIYFVNSVSDLFQKGVPFEWIDKIMAVIALTPQHTYQVLTKRADRMKEYFERVSKIGLVSYDLEINKRYFLSSWGANETTGVSEMKYRAFEPFDYDKKLKVHKRIEFAGTFPLPHLWLGVSVENQEQANKRIPYLLETPAAVRFLSCEPLLEDIKFQTQINFEGQGSDDPDYQITNWLKGTVEYFKNNLQSKSEFSTYQSGKIDWVIVGGESGHEARPMHPDWVRSIKDQCQSAGVPFFFKQMSSKDNKDYKNFEAFPKDLQVREMPKI
jgi:protein gp37